MYFTLLLLPALSLMLFAAPAFAANYYVTDYTDNINYQFLYKKVETNYSGLNCFLFKVAGQ